MFRRRLLIVALIAALWSVLLPVPSRAAARFPDTVDKSVALARGKRLFATATAGAVLRSSQRLPIRGNLVALSFRSNGNNEDALEDKVSITARFHTAKGWSGWEAMNVEPEESPDTTSTEARRASNRVFTAPIWVGTADSMAYRVTLEPRAPVVFDLRAHVINSLGDTHAPNIFERLFSVFSRILRGGEAEAMTNTPGIITRRQWGARESWRECCPRYAPSVQMAFVHHTAGTNSYSRSQSAALVRSIYKFHTSNRGWSDIGYNFLIDRYGQIFEGRYGGMTRPVIGAHVKGFNTGSTGISLMGTFTTAYPTTAMKRSLTRLLAWKLDVHHVPPTGKVKMISAGNPKYKKGRAVYFNRISGHRDGQQTSCPGAKVYYQLNSIRTSVNRLGHPKIYLPSVSSNVLRPNGDGANEVVAIRARFSRSVNWQVSFRTLGGTLLRSFSGTGTAVSQYWDGSLVGGALADTGVVQYTITARYGSAVARAAVGAFYFVNKHPDGTVLRTPTRTVVIEDGKARPVPSSVVLTSWYRATEPVATTDVEVDRYPSGAPLEIREGTLLAEPDGTYAVVSGGKLHEFDDGVYAQLGYTAASALAITADELDDLTTGPDISDGTRHPEGTVVRASDGSVWTIGDGLRRRNPTAAVWQSRYRGAEVVAPTVLDVALPLGDPMTYRDGTLFRSPDGSLWIFADGVKRRFHASGMYLAMGYAGYAPLSISTAEANAIPNGPAIS